jgi:hypothetical protein
MGKGDKTSEPEGGQLKRCGLLSLAFWWHWMANEVDWAFMTAAKDDAFSRADCLLRLRVRRKRLAVSFGRDLYV